MNWVQLNEKFSALSFRERALVFGGILTGLLFLLVQLFILPVIEKQAALKDQSSLLEQSLKALKSQYSALQVTLKNDPNEALLVEQALLQQSLLDLETVLQDQVATLLSPRQTQDLLRSLLSDYRGLKLVEARNLEPREIVIETKDSSSPADDINVKVFEHGFEMKLTGSYFETMKYIARLEELSGFYWSNVRYEVLEYPKAEILIGIRTLSVDEAWIGG
jgi:MSHA biogenesis protein MshJ